METYIVIYKEGPSYRADEKNQVFTGEAEVLSFLSHFIKGNNRSLVRIYSVNHYGTKITHYKVTFTDKLDLVIDEEKISNPELAEVETRKEIGFQGGY